MGRKLVTLDLIESNVNEVSAGGKAYSCTKIHYKDNGEPKSKNIFDQKLRDKIVTTMNQGDTVFITLTQNGKYWNLTDVELADGVTTTPTTATAQTTTTKQYGTTSDREAGMQVGNALTNAATLLASGQATGTLEEVAAMVLEVGERLKGRLVGGEFTTY